MSSKQRLVTIAVVLSIAFVAQAGLEAMTTIDRPLLKSKLESLPLQIGDWVGHDAPVDPSILKEAQADDYLSRIYEDSRNPGRRLTLWINYSTKGLNLRHSPEICLPSGGWSKVESQCKVIEIPGSAGKPFPLTRLGYSQGELVQSVGFWYYIFGEGKLEQYVRGLPIASRSSHGRTTRGSGLTVEVFCLGSVDPEGEALKDFATALLPLLEPVLPEPKASYHVP